MRLCTTKTRLIIWLFIPSPKKISVSLFTSMDYLRFASTEYGFVAYIYPASGKSVHKWVIRTQAPQQPASYASDLAPIFDTTVS